MRKPSNTPTSCWPPPSDASAKGSTGALSAATPSSAKPSIIPGECRPTVNVLVDLAKRMGVDPNLVPFKDSADVWDE